MGVQSVPDMDQCAECGGKHRRYAPELTWPQYADRSRHDNLFKKELEEAQVRDTSGSPLPTPECVKGLLMSASKIKRKFEVLTEDETRAVLGKTPRLTLNQPSIRVPYLEGQRDVQTLRGAQN